MWFFKKEPMEEKKEDRDSELKLKLVFRSEKFNIGRTKIRATFLDNRKFNFYVYGSFYQNYKNGCLASGYTSFEEAHADIPIIRTSLDQVKSMMMLMSQRPCTLVDDVENPKKSAVGQIISFEILTSESFEQ